jgi:uncharacterized protein YjbI with pentapeptide repeats
MSDETPNSNPKVGVLARASRSFKSGAVRLEESALFMYLRAFSRAGITLIALGFFLDLDDRQAATEFRAWQTLSSSASGNIGKAEAMEYLVAAGEVLDRTQARSAYLANAKIRGVSLSYADLSNSDLTGADMREAVMLESRLEGAVLPGAQFDDAILDELKAGGANLIGSSLVSVSANGADFSTSSLDATDLTASDFSYANLSDATLTGAMLNGTSLRMANISGADFSSARGATVSQFKLACVLEGVPPAKLPSAFRPSEFTFADCAGNDVWKRRLSRESNKSR